MFNRDLLTLVAQFMRIFVSEASPTLKEDHNGYTQVARERPSIAELRHSQSGPGPVGETMHLQTAGTTPRNERPMQIERAGTWLLRPHSRLASF